ncbi:2',3'-cyclic-nucleotide 2'-phosphodiesterase (5'-nucleotidase family) [Runella defluvii]|uniref:2',3'-cyclic-nucleotide 2'-phosphodiesterase (5'-nucleotidase family) n=1 Tax=Runella defluvii TaxID=370973 RepID=A0A7W5ZK79_9BACT|nr:bifunctional metallophosphatase/5'-nucleotidase [Runella defluvii]MBB3838403.1 2',3'-cyclic-nucleotide 2'-phosphodiesterase (5'-nucleotidase family) [Runella defluvii]
MHSRRKFIQASLLAGLVTESSEVLAEEKSEMKPILTQNGTITLLQTTDVHCQLHAHDELFWENNQLAFRKAGGYAHLATAIDQLRKQNPDNTFVMDTGDMFQGSMLSVKTSGQAFVPLLNAIGYDLYLPGNWEVVYYKQNMQKLMGGLMAPKVCANMYHDVGEGKKGELVFQPYHIIHKLGVKIGFLGYTDHLVPIRQSPYYSKGIVYTKPEDNIKYWVEVLKQQEQCDFVIVLAHIGLSQQIALANNPDAKGVDYVFGADTHERVRKPIQCEYAKVVEPGAFGSFVGRLDLQVTDGKIVGEKYELIEVNPKKYPAKPEIKKLVEEIEKPYHAQINQVIGYSTEPLYRNMVVENTIDTLIVDALKWKVNTEVVLSNGFRFCPPCVPDASGKVAITEGYLFDMLPVDATVRVGKATGQQLVDWLEKELQNVFAQDATKRFGGWVVRFKGMEVEFKAFERVGQRVKKVMIGDKPLELEKTYTIAACERDGDPADMLCRMKGVKEASNTSYTLHSVMKEYLKEFSPVSPKMRQAAKVLDAPQTLLSQVHGVDYQFL